VRLFRCFPFAGGVARHSVYLWCLALCLSLAWQPLGRLSAQEEPPATHEVRIGETLSEIAAAYGVPLAELMALNGISDPNTIRVGQTLILPEDAVRIGQPTFEIPTHTVGAGETLSEIARQYGISTARLMFLNGISDADAIYEGQVLRLPVEISEPTADGETDQATAAATATAADETPAATSTPTARATATNTPTARPTTTGTARPSRHVVQAAETLSKIAEQYDIPLQALMDANGIQNADAIYVGQELILPGAPTATATDTATPAPTATDEATPTPAATETPAPTATGEATAILETPDESATPAEDERAGDDEEEDASEDEEEPRSPLARITSLNRTYTVRRNDTIPRIAQRLGVDAEALRRINGLKSSFDLIVGEEIIVPPTAEDLRVIRPGREYTVQPGDSLSVIAKEFGVALTDLMAANYIGNPDTIAVGQQLVIPEPPDEEAEQPQETPRVGPVRSGFYYYTVQPGDTPSELAQQFDTTVLALLDYNDLPSGEMVYQGIPLRIPYGPPPLPVRLPPSPTSGSSFLVSLSRQECWLFWGKELHRRWRCSTGYGEFVTRTGNFAVQSKIENAKSNAYQLDMPYWLGIYNVGNYENGIHGLPVSWKTGKKIWTSLIGQPATFGCAMLSDEDAAELFEIAYIGMPVYIVD
jgi:LysM repeat protein